jgi:glucose/arabinose dehydrogenase
MSKIKMRWLWLIAGLEVAGIATLLIWNFVFRQSTPAPPPQTTQNSDIGYKTPKIELAQVVTGLSKPTAITAMPDATDKRLFIVEQDGTIRIVNADKTLAPTAFLDIKSKVKSEGEMGLLGLAFHPQVAQNHYFFVNYVDNNQNTIIARYTISTATGLADKASEKTLLKIKQPYSNHNGGQLAFGPDGYLYIGMGDGGSAGDPENRAQNKNELLGKILRIDVNNDNYAVPADNPFVKEGGKPEIWALGLRNPWRFSFDRKTGDLYIADVGQGNYEEIDLQKATSKGGENYGWRCYEGSHEFKTDGCLDANNYTLPILDYDHSDSRCSVTGGYVYRGGQYPALLGKYFFGDYCGGQLYYIEQKSGSWTATKTTTSYKISTFGEDSNGELYLADHVGGAVYQITDIAN